MNFNFILLLVILSSIAVQRIECNKRLLDKLTDNQIRQIFNSDRHNTPQFWAVNIQIPEGGRSRRDIRPVEFEADGKKFSFNLTPSRNSVTYNSIPVWTVASSSNSAVQYQQFDSYIGGPFYEDADKIAVFLPYYKNGYIFYDGVFARGNQFYTIRGVPELWRTNESKEIIPDHFIMKIENDMVYDAYQELKSHDENEEQLLDQPLTTLYPKLLAVVDYHVFRDFEFDVPNIVKYLALYWRSVDLIYKLISEPVVNIKLKGIILAKDEYAMDYVYRAYNYTNGPNFVNIYKMQTYANTYFKKHFTKDTGFEDYNAAFLMTGLDTGVVKGVAYIEDICTEGLNVGVIQYSKGYDGIYLAAHELGHSLGLKHDNANDPNHECYAYPGENPSMTVMAPMYTRSTTLSWTKCSIRGLKRFATLKKAECLKNSAV